MDKQLKDKIKGTLVVPLGISLILVPFSMFIGWSLLTVVVFWFVIILVLAIYLPILFSDNKNHLFESLGGLLIFYALMVFMIYDHYMTDYFKVMMLSGLTNMVLVVAFEWSKRGKSKVQL